MALNVRHIRESLSTLEVALHAFERTAKTDALYDVFRLAVIKSFELTIERIAKLLRKSLRAHGGASRSVDTLSRLTRQFVLLARPACSMSMPSPAG
jgi:hypothetical protein